MTRLRGCFSRFELGVPNPLSSQPSSMGAGGTPGCPLLSAGPARSGSVDSQQGPLPTPRARSLNPSPEVPAFPKGTSGQEGSGPLGPAPGRGRWTRGGEAQGAGEGRLPTWGLTLAARQRRLDPRAIKPVHGERSGAAAAPASCRRPAAGVPPPGHPQLLLPSTPRSCPNSRGPRIPSLSGRAQCLQSAGRTPKRPSASAAAPGGPIAHPPRPA